MAETKIGLSQMNKPAPLWYRRLSNGLIMFIIPGAIALVQGWGLDDHLANRWLMILGFIPAVLKGIAVMLGNGQAYTAEKITVLLIGCMLLASCKVTEKQVRSYPQLARVCADEYPVKTITTVTERVEHDTITLPGGKVVVRDTIPCPDGTRVPVEYDQPCPPVKLITQTVYRDSVVQVENTAAVEAARDDAAEWQLKCLQLADKLDKSQHNGRMGWLLFAALAGINLLILLVQGKLSWITKLFGK